MLRAFAMLMELTSERLSTTQTWRRVAEGNCVAARRGGEQPEANRSSQNSLLRQLNPIRPFGMASLRSMCEAQVQYLSEAISKHVNVWIARESEGGWGGKVGKVPQLSKEIPVGAEESGGEVRASIVALKRVTTVEPREVGK